LFAQRTNLIAGGNATGSESIIECDPERVEFKRAFFDPFRVEMPIERFTVGAAHGYSIQPLRGLGKAK
jgi:hypothetical protein